jgi:CHAD domain-containing protein
MKARKVKGLNPVMPLADAAERIIRVRLEELCSFVPDALDPARDDALHDLRIAAKRLRYLLEITAPCFGTYAGTAAKRARELQDLAGEIHDCDVMLPEVLGRVEELRAADAAALRERAGGDEELAPAAAPQADAYRGLEGLAAHLAARRQLLHERFVARWRELERRDFPGRLRAALKERPQRAAALASQR